MNEQTSMTLLGRLQDTADQDAWDRFYAFYTPLITGYCQDRGCNHEQTMEVIQDTFVCLMRTMVDFLYDPGRGQFRTFLLRVVNSRICDSFRRWRKMQTLLPSSNGCPDIVGQVEDTANVHPALEWKAHWKQNLMRQALERVRVKVHPKTFRSFELSTMENWSPGQVAEALGIEANSVYQHRNRVARLVKNEIRHLKHEWEDVK